jgi:Skp family chaperone for outer membrane proteins
MKKLIRNSLLAAGLAGLSLAAQAAEQKIATFNLGKALDGYYKTIQSTKALKEEESDASKEETQMIENERKHEDDYRKLIEKANDQAVSAEEREKSRQSAAEKRTELDNDKQSITEFDRMATARLREKVRLKRDDIVKEIEGVVEARAKAGGYTLVLDTSGESLNGATVVVYTNGQDDLTDGVIKELNAAAPPGSLDTNSAASSFLLNPTPSK